MTLSDRGSAFEPVQVSNPVLTYENDPIVEVPDPRSDGGAHCTVGSGEAACQCWRSWGWLIERESRLTRWRYVPVPIQLALGVVFEFGGVAIGLIVAGLASGRSTKL